MQRVKRSTAVAVLPNPPEGGTPGYFAAPNPQGGIDATVPGYEWFNAVQEEICAVVEAAGIALDEDNRTQLVAALIKKGMQGSYFSVATAAGTADAITAVFTPAIAALTHGMTLYVRAGAANATPTPTFTPAVGTIAAKTIVKGNNLPLVVGDIPGGGCWVQFRYDATLDKWVLENPAMGIATVTTTNDAVFGDNSGKPASTGWVRGAMAAIATAAGFAFSFGINGYIKFPSWLGGWIVQWGRATQDAGSSSKTFSFPISFPNACLTVVPFDNATSSSVYITAWDAGATTLSGSKFWFSQSSLAQEFAYLTIGY